MMDIAERVPRAAELALQDYSVALDHARDKLIADWLKLTDSDWEKTKARAESWIRGGSTLGPALRRVIDQVAYEREPRTNVADIQFAQLQAVLIGFANHMRTLKDREFSAEHQALCRMLAVSADGQTALDALAEIYRREGQLRGLAHPSEPSPF
ncbi:MAG: hypothetical protein E5X38_15975 [Mesorhizobium sp.]|uniref:hypothetical protein n=1 Tax=Mesorhizobium sp. TaxID=1871066 RepID=UPI00120BA0A1|nr:hypothetical protein [Mesorhizobium sp.]TIQ86446.1 MAG: hypothetical protein E5X38_15975 [Mesorhizobium sp.]